MSGVLIKEWSAFVLKEVRARKEVEREMLALQEEMRSMALHLRAEISGTRQEWVGDASFYGAEVRGVYEGQAAQRDRVVAFARRSFARQRVMRAMTQWGAVATAAIVRDGGGGGAMATATAVSASFTACAGAGAGSGDGGASVDRVH